jgi:hypothetical protein
VVGFLLLQPPRLDKPTRFAYTDACVTSSATEIQDWGAPGLSVQGDAIATGEQGRPINSIGPSWKRSIDA